MVTPTEILDSASVWRCGEPTRYMSQQLAAVIRFRSSC